MREDDSVSHTHKVVEAIHKGKKNVLLSNNAGSIGCADADCSRATRTSIALAIVPGAI